jgi:hypothetical protein
MLRKTADLPRTGYIISPVASQPPYGPRPAVPKDYNPARQERGGSHVHTLRQNTCKCRYICPSINVQPKNLKSDESIEERLLKGCPNLSEELVTKYLNPSPATAKGHMKRPTKGIRSTTKLVKTKGDSNGTSIVPGPQPQAAPHVLPLFVEPLPYNGPAYGAHREVSYITDNDKSIANMFCFGAFADKVSGVVYNDLTGNFPFMSIDGSVCFFVLYHCETNAILVKEIANVNDRSIFEAYKEIFETLEKKGYKPKMNVMDNQATKNIKKVSHRERMQFVNCGAPQSLR